MARIKKGDQVLVLAGKDVRKKGKVLQVLPKKQKAIVEKVNVVFKHRRADRNNNQGGILQVEAPIDLSNLALICPACSHSSRKKKMEMADGKIVRVCPQCGEVLN